MGHAAWRHSDLATFRVEGRKGRWKHQDYPLLLELIDAALSYLTFKKGQEEWLAFNKVLTTSGRVRERRGSRGAGAPQGFEDEHD